MALGYVFLSFSASILGVAWTLAQGGSLWAATAWFYGLGLAVLVALVVHNLVRTSFGNSVRERQGVKRPVHQPAGR